MTGIFYGMMVGLLALIGYAGYTMVNAIRAMVRLCRT